MDTQKIKQLLTLIANKSKSQTDYGNTKKYIMEIIDYHDSIVSIDVNDVSRKEVKSILMMLL